MSPRTILVVEDADDVRELFAVALRSGGFLVLEADSVSSALALLRSSRVDAVVADYNLGDGSGMELIHQARYERPSTMTPLRAVICSAYRYVEVPRDVPRLQKPVEPEVLVSTVTACLERADFG